MWREIAHRARILPGGADKQGRVGKPGPRLRGEVRSPGECDGRSASDGVAHGLDPAEPALPRTTQRGRKNSQDLCFPGFLDIDVSVPVPTDQTPRPAGRPFSPVRGAVSSGAAPRTGGLVSIVVAVSTAPG